MAATIKPIDRAENPAFFSTQVVAARRFYLELSPMAEKELAVVCAGYEQCSDDYRIERDSFPYYSLEVVVQGSGTLTLDGKKSRLLRGVAYSYGPGIPHCITTNAKEPTAKYFVDFVGRRAEAMLADCELAPGTIVNLTALGEIQSTLELLLHDGGSGASNASDRCRLLLEYLLQRIKTSQRTNTKSQTQAEATYQRCRAYMREHSQRLMTLEAVSSECTLDKAYLCRLFQRFDHQTPYQYLMKQKMDKAAALLENHDLLVSEVAFTLGYNDPFLFSRAFKSVFRVSPSEFRKLRS